MLTVSRFSELLAYCFSHTAQNQSIFLHTWHCFNLTYWHSVRWFTYSRLSERVQWII